MQKFNLDPTVQCNAEQKAVIADIKAGHNVCLLGRPGAGKSMTTKTACTVMRQAGYKVLLTGSTGTAVNNLEGDSTTNSMFGLGVGFYYDSIKEMYNIPPAVQFKKFIDKYVAAARGNRKAKDALWQGAYKGILIVIDEVSMTDARLLEVIYRFVSISKMTTPRLKVQWLLVGDPLQLPVVNGTHFYKVPKYETTIRKSDTGLTYEELCNLPPNPETNLLVKWGFRVHILMQNMRSGAHAEFSENLALLQTGEIPTTGPLYARMVSNDAIPAELEPTYVFPYHREVTAMNTERLAALRSTVVKENIHTFVATVNHYHDGAAGRERLIRERRPVGEIMEMIVGAPVRICQNLKRTLADNGVVKVIHEGTQKGDDLASNGMRGRIVALNKQKETVTVELPNGYTLEFGKMPLHVPKDAKDNPVGEYIQLPLSVAYATTGHSLQGLTISDPLVVCPWGKNKANKIVPVMPQFVHWMSVVCSRVTDPDLLYFWYGKDGLSENVKYQMVDRSTHVDPDALAWVESIIAAKNK